MAFFSGVRLQSSHAPQVDCQLHRTSQWWCGNLQQGAPQLSGTLGPLACHRLHLALNDIFELASRSQQGVGRTRQLQ